MQYNSWLYLFPFLGGSTILYYLIPVKRRWIGLLFSVNKTQETDPVSE